MTRKPPAPPNPDDGQPKLPSTDALRILIQRCDAYEKRLETEKGRKAAIGCNANVAARSYLQMALDSMAELEADNVLNRNLIHEHCPTGRPEYVTRRDAA